MMTLRSLAFLFAVLFSFSAEAAARFWVGGTGTWDGTTTTHWSATTGGAGGASVPVPGDTVTFDAASGGGTVTPSVDINIASLTCGAFTGTLDWSANNNNVTLSLTGGSAAFNGSGTGTRTFNMGGGVWTMSGANLSGVVWNLGTTTNLTFNANNSTLVFAGGSSSMISFSSGGLAYKNVTFNASIGGYNLLGTSLSIPGVMTVGAPTNLYFLNGSTTTIGTFALGTGSGSGLISFLSASTAVATISSASSPTMNGMAFRGITFTGGGTFSATNSFDLGVNTGLSVSSPTFGPGGGPSGILRPGIGK